MSQKKEKRLAENHSRPQIKQTARALGRGHLSHTPRTQNAKTDSMILSLFFVSALSHSALADDCKPVTTQANFDLDAYISAKWYIQQQMAVSYLPANQDYCVSAQYSKKDKSLFGYTIDVDNKAFEKDGTKHEGKICAASDGSGDPAKLEVAPCELPRNFAGPYWILEFDNDQGYALVSGGQPTKQGTDGCRTGDGVNGSGLWIFTRAQQRNETLVQYVRGLAQKQGFDLTVLNDVDQSNCTQA